MDSNDPRLAALHKMFPGQAILTHVVVTPEDIPVLVIMVTAHG
jgi:hypothetical protein